MIVHLRLSLLAVAVVLAAIRFSIAADSEENLVRFAPEGMDSPPHFAVAVINKATDTIHVSGRMAIDSEGKIIGKGDLLTQAREVYAGIDRVLVAAGTSPANVIHQRVFIVGMDEKTLPVLKQAMMEFYGDGPKAASTTVGVETLLFPDALIEIDVTAALATGSR